MKIIETINANFFLNGICLYELFCKYENLYLKTYFVYNCFLYAIVHVILCNAIKCI